jgi:hypothetical protein
MGAMEHVVLPFLATTATGARDATKRKWWGIVAPGVGGWNAYFGQVEAPHLSVPAEDNHSDTWTFGTRSMYLVAVCSGKGIIGSCPTS